MLIAGLAIIKDPEIGLISDFLTRQSSEKFRKVTAHINGNIHSSLAHLIMLNENPTFKFEIMYKKMVLYCFHGNFLKPTPKKCLVKYCLINLC